MCLWPLYGHLLWVSCLSSLFCECAIWFWELRLTESSISRQVTIINEIRKACFSSFHTPSHYFRDRIPVLSYEEKWHNWDATASSDKCYALLLSFLPLRGLTQALWGSRYCLPFFLLSVEILDIIGNDIFTLFVKYQFKLIFKLVH